MCVCVCVGVCECVCVCVAHPFLRLLDPDCLPNFPMSMIHVHCSILNIPLNNIDEFTL